MTYDTQKSFVKCEVNIRAVLASFFISTGGYDVSKAFAMVGVDRDLSFERNFSNHSFKISTSIRKVCDFMVHEAFVDEILLIYREISGPKVNDVMLYELKNN